MTRRSKGHKRRPDKDPLRDLDSIDVTPSERAHPPPIRLRMPARPRFEDRRRWAPGGREPPRDAHGRKARVRHQLKRVVQVLHAPHGKVLQSRHRVIRRLETASPVFAQARKTIICLKRKVRREVLFAFKRTRRGAGSPKRRNEWSNVQCH